MYLSNSRRTRVYAPGFPGGLSGFLCLAVFFLSCLTCNAVTIYVDAANAGSGTMDGSAGDPWDTIRKGADDLALQAGFGHTVMVQTGFYNEVVVLTNTHSGIPGTPNIFQGMPGDVYVKHDVAPHYTAWQANNVSNMTVTGFRLQSGHWCMVWDHCGQGILVDNCRFHDSGRYCLDGSGNLTVQNCVFRNSVLGAYCGNVHMRNCVFSFCENGFKSKWNADSPGVVIENCAFLWGIGYDLFVSPNTHMTIRNNCFYGDSTYVMTEYEGGSDYNYYETVAELEGAFTNASFRLAENNVVGAPCYANIALWDFDTFYSNSPCLGTGTGGCDIGLTPSANVIPTSDRTYYVATDGNDGSVNPTNPLTPWQTVARALCAVKAGDTVIVKEGVYNENAVLTNSGCAGFPIVLRADGNAKFSNGNSGNALALTGVANVLIDGFEFENNGAYYAGHCQFNTCVESTITNCHVHGGPGYGTGVQIDTGYDITVADCDIHDLDCSGVFPRYHGARTRVTGCEIYDIGSTFHRFCGISSYSGQTKPLRKGLVDNCVLRDCWGSGVYLYSALDNLDISYAPRIVNCNIVGNTNNGVRLDGDSYAVLENCIIANNGRGVCEDDADDDEAFIRYCCFYENGTNFWDENGTARQTAVEINAVDGCSNNMVADPKVGFYAHAEYGLAPDSPCINAGSVTSAVKHDMYGTPRPEGGACEIGVFEMPAEGSVMVFF